MLQKHKIAHLLRNLEFVIKRSRNKCAMTVLNIQSLVFLGEGFIRCQEVRKARGQAGLEDRKVRRYEGRLFTVKSLSSYPPTLLSSDNPLPQSLPQWREAEKSTSRFTLHTSLKKQVAFTLAEVLITLGIIGVVAALTMPSLIANHQKLQTVTQLKRTYNVLSNAVRMSVAENGDVEEWVLEDGDGVQLSSEFANTYLIPYLQVIKNCETDTTGECGYELSHINGSDNSASVKNYSRFILNDGTIVFIRAKSDPAGAVFQKIVYINVDINGHKRPNRIGRDYFEFALVLSTNNDMYKPLGKINASGQSQTTETIQNNCSKGTGEYCAAYIMNNGWQLPKDYPW